MTAVGDSTLAIKCLDFCQTLTSHGMAFNFSLNIGSSFSFSMDTMKNALALDTEGRMKKKKKLSPSTLRRNARRKEEFLRKKQVPGAAASAKQPLPSSTEEEGAGKQVENTFKCDQCNNTYKSENGLKIHFGKSHKNVNSTPPPPDRLRQEPGSPTTMDIPTSPLLDASREEAREEVREEKEVPLSPLRAGYDPRLRSSPIYPPKVPCLECFARDPCPLQCGYTSNWNGYTPG